MDSTMRTILLLLSACICLQFVGSAKLPASITPCKRNDPELNKCVLTEARKYLKEFTKGVPELGIPSLTPFTLPEVLAIDTGTDGVKFKLNSATVDTAQGLKINSLKFDIPKKKMSLDIKSNATIIGNYESKGDFLLMPVNGKGTIKLFLDSLRLKSSLDWKFVKGKDNQDHIQVTKVSSQYSIKDIKFSIQGLESKSTDKELMALFNENWRIVEEEAAPKFMKDIEERLVTIANKYFSYYSYNELFPL